MIAPPSLAPLVGPDGRMSREWLQFFTSLAKQAGSWQPESLADSSAANNTIYYSTTGSKLSYKDSGGTVHALY